MKEEKPDINDVFGTVVAEKGIDYESQEQIRINLFDFLNAINYNKEDLIVDESTEKQYLPFMVNRGLSFSADTVVQANEMNSRPHLDKKLQFHFLINIVRPKKRFNKWLKNEKIETIETIKAYYGFSTDKARQAASILNEDQLDYLKQKLQKGG